MCQYLPLYDLDDGPASGGWGIRIAAPAAGGKQIDVPRSMTNGGMRGQHLDP